MTTNYPHSDPHSDPDRADSFEPSVDLPTTDVAAYDSPQHQSGFRGGPDQAQYFEAPTYAGPFQHYGAPYGSHYAQPVYHPAQFGGWTPPVPPRPRRRRRSWAMGAGVAVLTAAAVVGGVAIGEARTSTSGNGSVAQQLPTVNGGNGNSGLGGNGSSGLGGLGGGAGSGSGGAGGNGGSSGGTTSAAIATSTQRTGVVTIVSVLKYQNAESAGTGMILTSNGEVLTNNHVVNGATSITVTDGLTGKSYRASVVGDVPTQDVAVLQLHDASGLRTAKIGTASTVTVGAAVTGVGNAGGTGALRAAKGAVTALNQSITATDEQGMNGEKLTGLIQTSAGIVAGDSGGPLYNAAGAIIGMDTAASTSGVTGQTAAGYAISIDKALGLAKQVESRVQTSTVQIGLPPFLGVGIANSSGGALVEQAIADPALSAGIDSGSVITGVGGKRVTSGNSLKALLAGMKPGDRVAVSWTDSAGVSHRKVLTLNSGPAN